MLPSGATFTRMTSPHLWPLGPVIPSGSVGQSGTNLYGLGRLVGGFKVSWAASCGCWVIANAETRRAPVKSARPTRAISDMLDLRRESEYRRIQADGSSYLLATAQVIP